MSTAPRSNNDPDLLYVQVKKDVHEGFWEINMNERRALFRGKNVRLLPSDNVHDWTEIYNTISDYLQANTLDDDQPIHAKEIIRNRSYRFDTVPICSFNTWIEDSNGSPIQKRCKNSSEMYCSFNNQPYCREHLPL